MQIEVIDPSKTAMIVVDMQNDFVASGAAMETPAAREMVPKLAEALNICRDAQIKVIYTAHVHRRDGCDMGLFDDMHPPIANRAALVDGTWLGVVASVIRPVNFASIKVINRGNDPDLLGQITKRCLCFYLSGNLARILGDGRRQRVARLTLSGFDRRLNVADQ